MGMIPFDTLFPDVAQAECRTATPHSHPVLPDREFVFTESYCSEPGCDCRRVLLSVFDTERREQVATIGHGFDPPKRRHAAMGQTYLDPLNPQSPFSAALLDLFKDMIDDPDDPYGARLERHYEMWKAVVDDPSHPLHGELREAVPGFGSLGLAPRRPVRRDGPKVGANDPCPCGSGKKFKRCCRP